MNKEFPNIDFAFPYSVQAYVNPHQDVHRIHFLIQPHNTRN